MILKPEVKTLIADLFEEEALVIGGLVATHDIEDDVVWNLVRSLDLIRRRTLARIDEVTAPEEDGIESGSARSPHPAIEDLLLRIQEGRV